MAKKLVIVESPSKCKTIGKYLGNDYIIKASVGHIREIPTDKSAIDLETFDVKYVISEDRKDVVSELKKSVKDAEFVYYGTDFDREGEGISWHLQEVLQVPKSKYKRITFTEITKKALEEAIKNPRDIDMDLVNAQKTRQICDRIAGFGMSGLLNFKIQRGTSAGRVQSIGLLLICNNWKNYEEFYKKDAKSEFKVIGLFEVKDDKNKIHILKSTLNKKFSTKEEARKFLEKCSQKEFAIKSIETSEGRKKAPAPYNTSSMQIDAIRKLGMTAERVAKAAQGLYMAGHVSYIRTDSVSMSEDALIATEKKIKKEFGENYHQRKQHQTKGKNSQESHECVRSSDFDKHEVSGTSDEVRLYELIWKRALSSQMSDCIVDKTVITISTDGIKEEFQCRGEIIKFDGYKKLYTEETSDENKDEEDDKAILPNVKKGQSLKMLEISGTEIFQRPKALFNEATLLKELETIGVGRPSTIATIAKLLITRTYVDKRELPAKKRDVCNLILKNKKIEEEIRSENFGKETGKMIPTELGMIVCEYLIKNFPNIMNPNYTSELEGLLDSIAEGKEKHLKVLKEFNDLFQDSLKTAKGSTDKPGSRELGLHPVTRLPIYARLGRFGPMIQMGESVKQEKGKAKEEKPKSDVKFGKIPEGLTIETITLEQALNVLSWPKNLGEYKKLPVEANTGKFGDYVKHNSKFYSISIPKEQITLNEAIKVIEDKESGAGKEGKGKIKEFGDIKVMNGQYGPYISYKAKNYKIPAPYTAESITKAECDTIISEAKSAPKKKFVKKKK